MIGSSRKANGDISSWMKKATSTFENNLIGDSQFRKLQVYGERLRRTDKYLLKAYDKIGPWVAQNMPKSIAKQFSIAYLSDQNKKPSMFMKVIRATSRPLMRLIGRFL